MTKLLGYRRFKSTKNNKEYCTAMVVHDLTERERMSGSVGQKSESLFLPDELYDYLRPDDIGKEVILDYEISDGRARLVGLAVVGKDKK